MFGQAADISADRHLIVIQDDDQVFVELASIVHRLESHAAGQGTVTDQGDHLTGFTLTVVKGAAEDFGAIFSFDPNPVTIGRSHQADLLLHDQAISKRHCTIEPQRNHPQLRFLISDLAGRSIVNGKYSIDGTGSLIQFEHLTIEDGLCCLTRRIVVGGRLSEFVDDLLGEDYLVAAYRSGRRHCAVTFLDVTERRRAENAVRELHDRPVDEHEQRAQGASATLSEAATGTILSTFVWSGLVFAVLVILLPAFAVMFVGAANESLSSTALVFAGISGIAALPIATLLAATIGLMLAIFLDQKIRGEGVLRPIYLYPMALSFIVTGTAWTGTITRDASSARPVRASLSRSPATQTPSPSRSVVMLLADAYPASPDPITSGIVCTRSHSSE